MVEDGKIISMFDTDETVGDQMLLEVLDESSDIKMKSIVTTIQKEQNKIIRDTQSDLLFVQGAAGSGKDVRRAATGRLPALPVPRKFEFKPNYFVLAEPVIQ